MNVKVRVGGLASEKIAELYKLEYLNVKDAVSELGASADMWDFYRF
jgi:hypothetical protein